MIKNKTILHKAEFRGLPDNPITFINPGFEVVTEFEERIAAFFGAPYAVAVDSCTSGIELCLRHRGMFLHRRLPYITCPKRTYLSVPMLANKLGCELIWMDWKWEDYYFVAPDIIDAAVLWRADSYSPGKFMCISFQYQKHLSVGRLGVILCDDQEAAIELKKMSYDGRLPGIPWREQNVKSYGYHYYATPEACQIALNKMDAAIATPPKIWSYLDYPDLTNMDVFKTLK